MKNLLNLWAVSLLIKDPCVRLYVLWFFPLSRQPPKPRCIIADKRRQAWRGGTKDWGALLKYVHKCSFILWPHLCLQCRFKFLDQPLFECLCHLWGLPCPLVLLLRLLGRQADMTHIFSGCGLCKYNISLSPLSIYATLSIGNCRKKPWWGRGLQRK